MTGSYWQRDAAWCDRWHEAPVPDRADVVIIGGGFSGLTTAIRLRELHPDADVVLLEAERVGHGASGRNAGFLSPVAAPIWLLGADRSADQRWAAAYLNEQTHAIASWLAASMPDVELSPASLSIGATSRLTDAGLGELARALEVIGLAHTLAESRAQPGHLFLEMDAYTVHPYKLVRALAEQADRAGVRIHERAGVRAIEAMPAGARVCLSRGSEIRAPRVVVCTNAYTSTLDVGERVRALAVHSFMLASAPLDRAALAGLVRDADFTVELNRADAYHRLRGDRILYGGRDKVLAPPGGDFAVPDKVRSRLARDLCDSFPALGPVAVAEAWSGKFHATLNGLPIIRPSESIPGVVLNVGYGGTGVALSLVCAPLAAALASGDSFSSADDARLLSVIRNTGVPVRDTLRAITRLAVRLARPW